MATNQLDIETATEEELASVRGITGRRAKDIIRARDSNGGRFTRSDFTALKLASATQKKILENGDILFSDSTQSENVGSLLPQVAGNVGKSETRVDDKPIVTGLVQNICVSTGEATGVNSGVEGATRKKEKLNWVSTGSSTLIDRKKFRL